MVSSLAAREYSPPSMANSYSPPYTPRTERLQKASTPSFEQAFEQIYEQIYEQSRDPIEENTSCFTAHELQTIGKALQSKASPKKPKPNGPRRCQTIKKTDKKTAAAKPPSPARAAVVEMIQRVERRAAAQSDAKLRPAEALLTQPDLSDYEEDEGDDAAANACTPPATPKLQKTLVNEDAVVLPTPSELDESPVPEHDPEHKNEPTIEPTPESESVPILELEAKSESEFESESESEPEPEPMHWDVETGQDVTTDMLLAIVISGMESLSIGSEVDLIDPLATNQMPSSDMDLDEDSGLVQATSLGCSLVESRSAASSSTGAAKRPAQCSAPAPGQAISAATSTRSATQAPKSTASGRLSSVPLSPVVPSHTVVSVPPPPRPSKPGRRRERACPLLPSTTRRERFAKTVSVPPTTSTKRQQPLPWSTPRQVPLPRVSRAPAVRPEPHHKKQPFPLLLPSVPSVSKAPPKSRALDPIAVLVEAMAQLTLDLMSTATSSVGRNMNRWKQFLPTMAH